MTLVTKRVAVAPFELNIGPNESDGRAASVGTPPGAKTAQIRAKIIVKLPIHRPGGRYVNLVNISARGCLLGAPFRAALKRPPESPGHPSSFRAWSPIIEDPVASRTHAVSDYNVSLQVHLALAS